MPVHEQITQDWADARPILADAFHSADYLITRMTRVPDGYGGHTDIEAVVESGMCSIEPGTGGEGTSGPLTVSQAEYTAEMPKETTLTAADTLYVNGRKFEVTVVLRGDDHEVFPAAGLKEAS